MESILREYLDFIRYESRFGLKILLRDMIGLINLRDQTKSLEWILDSNKEHGSEYTFFFVAKNIGKRLDLVDRIIDEGHEVASHGFNHVLLDRVGDDELRREFGLALDVFNDYGIRVSGFRPPHLSVNESVLDAAKKAGFRYISSSLEGVKFRHSNGLLEIPIVEPYDWYAFNVLGISVDNLFAIWQGKNFENQTFLFHPTIISIEKNKNLFERVLGMNEYLRLNQLVTKDGVGISFDVY